MKIIVRILVGLVVMIALVLIIALFVKSDYTIRREVTINRPKQQVYDYVHMLRNSDNYNVWSMADPGMKKEYRGTDGTVGFVYAWDSTKDEVGQGEQELKSLAPGDSTSAGTVGIEIRFIRPFEGKASSTSVVTPDGPTRSTVSWTFESKMAYPMNFVMLFINMEDMLGKDLEKTLNNLKTTLEK